MITRVVKMSFRNSELDSFMNTFNMSANAIRNFEGCQSMKLMRENGSQDVFFTISIWDSHDHLEAYRASDLFKNTWAKVKPLFSAKAEAWTLHDTGN